MPNRIIKESIRTSDSLSELSWFEEVLFYRLIVSCDDYGRFDARPAIIKGTCFPLKTVTDKQIVDALNKLSTAGIVCLYEVDRKPYLQFVTWERHQTIRAKKSKYPSPDDGNVQITSHENICKQMHADVSVIQSNSKTESYSESETYSGDERLDAALREFIKFRKQIKKPLTDHGIELILKKLDKLAQDVDEKIEIIDQSIEKGWTGIFPLKDPQKGKSQGFYDEMREWVNDHECSGIRNDSERN